MDSNVYLERPCRKQIPAPLIASSPGRMGRALIAWGLIVLAGFVIAVPSRAADAAIDPTVARMETKLFRHEYPKDELDARLERLEKMVFGEGKSGSSPERIKNLMSAVPNLDNESGGEDRAANPDSRSLGTADAPEQPNAAGERTAKNKVSDGERPPDGSRYPAVTAIESKLFGKDFGSEAVNKRLERLETKVFGHPSGIDDLSERVDRLKQRTGIDIAKQAPPGTDWADDDEIGAPAVGSPVAGGGGEDGRSFSGRDLRKDLGIPDQGISDRWTGTGSYGMAGTASPRKAPAVARSNGARAPVDDDGMPPQMVPGSAIAAAGQPIGLNQQVGALEQEIFGKSYIRDALPARLSRLETTVFPQQKPAVDKSLPERVSRLLTVVPLSRGGPPQRSIAQNGGRARQVDPDFADFEDATGMPQGQQPRSGSGLSKIINSIGSFLTGGYTGGYPIAPNGIVTDPQTGLWLDPRTGSLIDPITGAVVGQRAVQPGIGSSMNGFGSFSNGFAPYGVAPYGTGYGTGMHFGFGGIGRSGGMWP